MNQELFSFLVPVVGATVGSSITAGTSIYVFIIHARKKAEVDKLEAQSKAQVEKAMSLLSDFMTQSHYIKARLTTQEYLCEWGRKYHDYKGLNLEQVDLELLKSNDLRDHEARFHIRLVTDFFWLVDQLRSTGQIKEDEKAFNFVYSWYWVMALKERTATCLNPRQFREFEWMLTSEDMRAALQEKDERRSHVLGADARAYATQSTPPENRVVLNKPVL